MSMYSHSVPWKISDESSIDFMKVAVANRALVWVKICVLSDERAFPNSGINWIRYLHSREMKELRTMQLSQLPLEIQVTSRTSALPHHASLGLLGTAAS